MPTLDEISAQLGVPRRTLQRYYATNSWPRDVVARALELGLADEIGALVLPTRKPYTQRAAPRGKRRRYSFISSDGGATYRAEPHKDTRKLHLTRPAGSNEPWRLTRGR